MKTLIILIPLFLHLSHPVFSQSFEIQQLTLDIQKLSEEKQLLNDLYKSYDILNKGYTEIRDIAKGNFKLHKLFLDGLLTASPAVRQYGRVKDILNLQLRLAASTRSAWSTFQREPLFSAQELNTLNNIYSGLLTQSINNLGTLSDILTDGHLRADDGERIHQIDGLYSTMQTSWPSLQKVNSQAGLLGIQRTTDEQEIKQLLQLYGGNK